MYIDCSTFSIFLINKLSLFSNISRQRRGGFKAAVFLPPLYFSFIARQACSHSSMLELILEHGAYTDGLRTDWYISTCCYQASKDLVSLLVEYFELLVFVASSSCCCCCNIA